MKYIVLKKRNIVLICNVILTVFVIFMLSFSFGVKSVMTTVHHVPVTGVKIQENKVALSVNVYENTDVDSIVEALGDTRATFFVSEAFENLRGVKVSQLVSLGYNVGVLEDGLMGKTGKEISDRLAERIERQSFLTGKNCDLVRFNNNSFDRNCIETVFTLGLYPVQWATDDTAEYFSAGDIILITGESEIDAFIEKLTADGFETSTVDGMILKRNYRIDFGGEQSSVGTD